jgi:hypothetical protein
LAAPVAGAIFLRVVLMTSRLAGLDRFPQIAELPLLITLGCVAYFGFVALFGQRTIFSHLAFVSLAAAAPRPSMVRTSDSCVDQVTERQRRGLRKCNTWSGSAQTCRVAVGVAIDSR